MKAFSTSSILPVTKGMISIPDRVTRPAKGWEIAPHMRTSTPRLDNLLARNIGGFSSRGTAMRLISLRWCRSNTRRDCAKSKTVETRPAHTGIATFIFCLCLSTFGAILQSQLTCHDCSRMAVSGTVRKNNMLGVRRGRRQPIDGSINATT
jgi:hypothetical protein